MYRNYLLMKEKNEMANFYETVLTVLKSDERFVAEDGTFLRNAVYEAAMKMIKILFTFFWQMMRPVLVFL